MTGERKIVGLWPADADGTAPLPADMPAVDAQAVEPEPLALETPVYVDEWPADTAEDEELIPPARFTGIAVALGGIALLWMLSALWRATSGLTALPPLPALPDLVVTTAPPLVLMLVAAMLMGRTPFAAARRHLALLAALRREHDALQDRLRAMDEQWQGAQRQIEAEAATLSGFGLDAASRLHDASAALNATMATCAEAAASLAREGAVAQRQLDSLVIAIPRVEEVAGRLAENLRQAGQSAYQFGGQLEARVASLTSESQRGVGELQNAEAALRTRIAELQAAVAVARDGVDAAGDDFATRLERQRDAALALLAEFAASLTETSSHSLAQLDDTRSRLTAAVAADLAATDATVAATQARIETMREAMLATRTTGSDLDAALAQTSEAAAQRLAVLEADSSARFAALQTALALLQDGVDAFAAKTAAGDEQATALISRAETLLIALDSTSRELEHTLPGALERLDGQAATSLERLAALGPAAAANQEAIASAQRQLAQIDAALTQQQQRLAAFGAEGATIATEQRAALTQLLAAISAVQQQFDALAAEGAPRVAAMLTTVETAASEAGLRTSAVMDAMIDATATAAQERIGTAISRASGPVVEERLAEVSAIAERAVAAATAASERLMRQLITISESSAALERRVAEIADVAASREQDTLARQMVLLSEALQSTAVDMTRVIDSEIADQAWEAYLKGDRSVFARRAVRLLSATEARDILRRYEGDDTFRAQVNRYIHDFEAMLRGLIDTRDGAALSVTLLSSDIGKLYVALAQAIERLRR